MRRLRRHGTADDDSGFGLVEMIVALLIAGVVFGALATTLVAAVRSSLFGRQNQQATDFMTQAVEEMRQLSYGSLSLDAAALSGDPRLTTCPGGLCLDVQGTPEPVITRDPAGVAAVTTLISAQTNGTTFVVRRYVTAVPGTDDELVRRVSVYVTWSTGSDVHERSTSTIISYGQRGLPLPSFRLDPAATSQSINPGSRAVHTFTLSNQGAPDRWNLALTGDSAGFTLHADTDPPYGVYTDGLDALLSDTSGDGVVDTGRIDPGTDMVFFLVLDSSPSASPATLTTTVSASSAAQPPPGSQAKTATATTVITLGSVGPTPGPSPTGPPAGAEIVCPAASAAVGSAQNQYTLRSYALHNEGTTDSVTLPQLYMNAAASTRAVLDEYSTDVAPGISGRQIAPTIAAAANDVLALSDPTTYADWAYQVTQPTQLQGTSVLRFWVAAPTGALPVSQLRAVAYTRAVGATAPRIAIATATATLNPGCAGFQEVYLTFDTIQPAVSLATNQWMGIRLVNNGPATLRLGYDEPSQVPADYVVGVKW